MVSKTDLMELKKNFKKETCHIQRMAAAYITLNDTGRSVKCSFDRTFLNLDDDEFYKYLDIAKKTISGPVGDNILEQPFEKNSQMQKLLMGLIKSELKDNGLLEAIVQRIMDEYETKGNYLVLLFYDSYDIPVKTTDKMKLDDSEETYSYLICSICPVSLSKPGLGYRNRDNNIGVLDRDWVVDAPENGFLFPSFSERSADIDTVTVYTKDKKNPNGEIMSKLLECKGYMTVSQQKQIFTDELTAAFISDDEEADDTTTGEAKAMVDSVIEAVKDLAIDEPEKELTPTVLEKILEDKDIPKDKAKEVAKAVTGQLVSNDDGGVQLQNIVSIPKEAKVKRMPTDEYLPENTSEKTIYLTLPKGHSDSVRVEEMDGKKVVVIEVDDDLIVSMNGKKIN